MLIREGFGGDSVSGVLKLVVHVVLLEVSNVWWVSHAGGSRETYGLVGHLEQQDAGAITLLTLLLLNRMYSYAKLSCMPPSGEGTAQAEVSVGDDEEESSELCSVEGGALYVVYESFVLLCYCQ